MRMKKRKAPGDNGIPAEAYQMMDDESLGYLHHAIVRFWTEPDLDPAEWHTVVLKLLAKKGDLSQAKNWRPIALLDVLSKSVSRIIQMRLDSYLVHNIGIQEQNGFSSGRGCVDGTAALKITLQNLRQATQDSFVLFVDLVKAFDSVNREMLWQVLLKMGIPSALINVIEKMYRGVEVTCDVNGVNLSFPSKSGVKQGDPLAPILFLFAIQAALESMDKQWPVRKPTLEWSQSGGRLSTRVTGKSLVALEFNRSLFADDAAFIFLSKEELIVGSKHVCEHFAKFGLEVHLGNRAGNGKETKSKTEFMHIQANREEEPFTENFDVFQGRFISSCQTFRYLGSIISNDLDDTVDIEVRIAKAKAAFHYMRPVLLNKKIHSKLRASLYTALVANNALWGCDSWAMTKKHYRALDTLQNYCVRRMSGMTLYHCQHYRRSMDEMHEKLRIPKLSTTARIRQLRYLEKTAHQPISRLTRQIIGCQAPRPSADFKFTRGRHTTTQSTYRDTLEAAGLCKKGSGGDLGEWMPLLTGIDASRTIEENLGVPIGTYSRGRRKPKSEKTTLLNKLQ